MVIDGCQVTCMNEQSELSKERDSCQAARKLHEEAQCKLDTDRRTLEERVQKMTESVRSYRLFLGHTAVDLPIIIASLHKLNFNKISFK